MHYLRKLKIILKSNAIIIILAFFICLYVLTFTKIIKYSSKFSKNENIITGKVLYYKIDGNKLSIELKAREKVVVVYYLKNIEEKNYFSNININDVLKINGELIEPSNNRIPNTFNYKKYLYNKRIFYIFEASKIQVLERNFSLKSLIYKRISKCEKEEYLRMFLVGDKSGISTEKYQENGISHLLAISGMHVSFLLDTLENKFKIKNKYIQILVLFLYSYIVSFAIGVLRVLIYRFLKLIFQKFRIGLSDLRILFFSMITVLLINPFYVYDYGFIYSFLISFSLMYVKVSGNYFTKLLKISIISFFVSFPINILLNYQINFMTIINNVFFVPFISLIVFPFSFIVFIFPRLSFIYSLLIYILEFLNNNIITLCISFSRVRFYEIILYYLILYVCYKTRKKYCFILFALLVTFLKFKPFLDQNLYIYYLDVGQGDCEVIIFPHHSNVLIIDTGGKFAYQEKSWQKKVNNSSNFENIYLFFLSVGITSFNDVIVTHGDYDHMGESINLVENFKVGKVIFNCGEFNELEKDLIKVLDKKKIPYYSCIKELNIDKNKLYFLQTKEYDNENDNSNVIYFNYNDYKFLFMGDAGIEKEKDILDKYNLKDIDFLKVGHHGSNTSSDKEFINIINPKYSLISVGKNNRYGHPKVEVLETLKNSKIYRTDLDGSIEIKLNRNGYKIRTCPPYEGERYGR